MADISTIYAAIAADAAFMAAVGSRFYDTRVPENVPSPVPTPYSIAQQVASVPEQQLTGSPGVDHVRIQFDIYATTTAAALTVLPLLRAVLDPLGVEVGVQHFLDRDSDLRRVSVDFEFFLAR